MLRPLHFVGTFQCPLHQEMNHLLQGRHCFQGHLPRISFRCYLLVCSIVFMHFLPCLLSPPAECTCKQQDSFCFVLLLFQIQSDQKQSATEDLKIFHVPVDDLFVTPKCLLVFFLQVLLTGQGKDNRSDRFNLFSLLVA